MNEMERGSEVRNLVPPNFPVNLRFRHKSLVAVELAGSFCRYVAHRQILPIGRLSITGGGKQNERSTDFSATAQSGIESLPGSGDSGFHHLDCGRADEDDENSREDEEHHREQHLNGGLLSLLFGHLTTFHSHGLRLNSECLGD